MKYYVPKDVKRFVLKKRLARIIPFICIEVLAAVLLFFAPFLRDVSNLNKILTFSAVTLFCCLIIGVPLKIIDRSWAGEVTRVQYRKVRKSSTPGKPSVASWRQQDFELFNAFELSIKTDNGRIIKRKAGEKLLIFTPNDKEEYQPGDYVVHVSGTSNTVILNRKDNIRCAVCGASSEKGSEICHCCGYHLIKVSSE